MGSAFARLEAPAKHLCVSIRISLNKIASIRVSYISRVQAFGEPMLIKHKHQDSRASQLEKGLSHCTSFFPYRVAQYVLQAVVA